MGEPSRKREAPWSASSRHGSLDEMGQGRNRSSIVDDNDAFGANIQLPATITAYDLLRQEQASSAMKDPLYLLQNELSSDHDVESWLRLVPGKLHEVSGAAGSGKTQVALSTCLSAAAASDELGRFSSPSDEGGSISPPTIECCALYVSLKGSGTMNKVLHRLKQMASNMASAINRTKTESHSPERTAKDYLQRIVTRTCVQTDDFWDFLNVELPQLLEQNPKISVICLDSMADIFRGEVVDGKSSSSFPSVQTDSALNYVAEENKKNASVQSKTRASWLMYAASVLIKYAERYNLVIVAINQVSWNDNRPALGLAWSHFIHTRYLLSKTNILVERSETPASGHRVRRRVTLLKSMSTASGATAEFFINTGGAFYLATSR